MSNEKNLEAGDVVVHRSGSGPSMVVTKVEDNVVWCEWLEVDGARKGDTFLPTSLKKLKED